MTNEKTKEEITTLSMSDFQVCLFVVVVAAAAFAAVAIIIVVSHQQTITSYLTNKTAPYSPWK